MLGKNSNGRPDTIDMKHPSVQGLVQHLSDTHHTALMFSPTGIDHMFEELFSKKLTYKEGRTRLH